MWGKHHQCLFQHIFLPLPENKQLITYIKQHNTLCCFLQPTKYWHFLTKKCPWMAVWIFFFYKLIGINCMLILLNLICLTFSKDICEKKTNKVEASLTWLMIPTRNKGMGQFTTGAIKNMSKCLLYIQSQLNSACLIKHVITTTDISLPFLTQLVLLVSAFTLMLIVSIQSFP